MASRCSRSGPPPALLTMPVIMMSGHATIDTAVEATKIGALAFLEKPITLQKLLKAVEQGLARGSLRKAGGCHCRLPSWQRQLSMNESPMCHWQPADL